MPVYPGAHYVPEALPENSALTTQLVRDRVLTIHGCLGILRVEPEQVFHHPEFPA
jgi:hypothetical protein